MHRVATDHACKSFSRLEKQFVSCGDVIYGVSQCYFGVERCVTSKGRGCFVGDLLLYSFWGFVFQTGKVELFMKRVDLSGFEITVGKSACNNIY